MGEATGETILDALTDCHERLAADLRAQFANRATTDDEFRSELPSWAIELGIADAENAGNEDLDGRVAEQVAVRLVVSRLLAAQSENTSRSPPDEQWPDLDVTITDADGEVVVEHDELPAPIRVSAAEEPLDDFVAEHDATQFDADVIGRFYERVLPEGRRSERGEFYTPPAICDLVARLTIQRATDTVLDPACGVGRFLTAAADRKAALASEQADCPDPTVDQLTGIDVDGPAARLSALTLASSDGTLSTDGDLSTDDIDVRVTDFFHVAPPAEGYDAVVGNPPYVRGRSLDPEDKTEIRDHLAAVDAEWLTRKMDLYGYFLTHSTAFLREGGRLGFVVSDRWLDTRYGTDLQRFLLETYRIEAVLKFRRQAFADALVGSAIVILERDTDRAAREANVATFLDVRAELSIDEIATLVTADTAADRLVVTDEYRLVTRRQRGLGSLAKWNALFAAPPIYFDLRASETVELRDRADLHTGLESGANDFFYRHREAIEDRGLTEHFTPLLKASGQIDRIRPSGECEWGVFDVSDLAAQARAADRALGDTPVEHVKGWLAAEGHDAVLDYVAWGEREGYHAASRRCRNRDVWFDIDDSDRYRPPLAMPLFTWHHHRTVRNRMDAVTDRQFHAVRPHDGVDQRVLCGILNSRLTWLAREIEGRHAGGQGMTRLQTVKYEAAGIPIPDPLALDDTERERIADALTDLIEREDELVEAGVVEPSAQLERTEAERDALDRAVLATLGLDDRLDDLKRSVAGLIDSRRDGAGERTTVLVDRTGEQTVVDLQAVVDADRRPRD